MKKRIRSERDLYNWLFEQTDTGGAAGAPAGENQKEKTPDISSVTGTTNIADVDPKALVNAMQNPEANPQILKIINDGQKKQYNADQIKAFVEKIGPEELAKRIGEVGSKLPETGLPKAEMPFLPASDIEDWNDSAAVNKMIDAVSPGGELQVDWLPPHAPPPAKGATIQQEAIRYVAERAARYMKEAPEDVGINTLNNDPAGADSWLKAGNNDGQLGEDEPAVSYVDQAPLTISTMVPTQKNVLIGKTLNFALGNFPSEGIPLGAYVVDAGKGTEILDGHHRWSAGYILNPNMKLTGHLFKTKGVPTARLLPILTRLGNALGKPTKLKESFSRGGLNEYIVRRSPAQPSFDLARWQRLAGIKR